MCKIMEEFAEEERKDIAVNLLKLDKLSFEEIAQAAKLYIDQVKEISEKLKRQTA